jgi:serine/threonine protein kinase
MALTIGTQLGSHEIIALLGEGGMGVVYRARDTKLGRDVAIKTLPQEFTSDADRLARFQREAKLLASLNHPNIGAIYGLEEFNNTPFLILELVEGETLRCHPGSRYRFRCQRDGLHSGVAGEVSELQTRDSRKNSRRARRIRGLNESGPQRCG